MYSSNLTSLLRLRSTDALELAIKMKISLKLCEIMYRNVESEEYWLKTCSAESLLEGSRQIIFLNRSLASGDTERKIFDGNLRFPLSTASKVSAAPSPNLGICTAGANFGIDTIWGTLISSYRLDEDFTRWSLDCLTIGRLLPLRRRRWKKLLVLWRRKRWGVSVVADGILRRE